MQKLSAILLFAAVLALAYGAEIPVPAGMYDSLVHPEFEDYQYSSAVCSKENAVVTRSQNIGDFDGDGSDDIFVQWTIPVRYYYKDGRLSSRESGDDYCSDNRYHVGVYALVKKKYLFQDVRDDVVRDDVITGDFDGDTKMDFVIGNKIYLGVNSLHKKKASP